MEMFTNYFSAIPFDIFNLSLVGCGIVFAVALVLTVLFLALKCDIIYYDMDGGKHELHRERHSWFSRVKIHSANKRGKKLIGWSMKPNGKKPLLKHTLVLFRTVKLYAIWEEAPIMVPISMVPEKVEEPVEEVDYSEGVFVKFNYVDTQTDEIVGTESFKINGRVPTEDGVDGWCFKPQGEIVLQNGTENHIFEINLYPVCALLDDDSVEVSDEAFTGECVVDLAYVMSSTDKTVYKESHYLTLKLPRSYEAEKNFVGWSNEPDGNVVMERGESDTIFTLKFFSYEEATEEATEEVAEEVTEEVVEETCEEVVETVEPAPLYEEIIEEYIAPVVEEPVYDDVVEEYIVPEEIVEEPEEEVVTEPIYEDIVEEEPCEEVVEVVEPAPLYEEIVEEYIAPVVEEPVAPEAPTVEDTVVDEPIVEEPTQTDDNAERLATIVPTYYDNEGNKIDIKYSRSFTANIIQSDDTVKNYYSELKNHILSYKGVKSRISWKFDSYNRGRDQLFKVKLRGKTICLYCALDPNEFDESRYHHDAINAKIFADVPMLVKIKSGLGLRKAKELVDIVMAKFNIEKDPKAKEVDYVAKYPYEPNEPLLERVLIKALEADDSNVVVSTKPKEELVVEETPVVEEPVVEEPVVEEPVVEEPVVEEPVVEEPVVEEPVIEEPVIEEPVVEEPAIEEPVVEEPVVEEPAIEEYVEPEIIVESVSAEDAHHIVEEKHVDIHVEEDVDYITKNDNKKAIVNIDTLSKSYSSGELVDIKSLKDKKLIDKKAKSVKVLARGRLDKPLRVKAGEFSGTAIEMILLTGGQAMHVTYKVKK